MATTVVTHCVVVKTVDVSRGSGFIEIGEKELTSVSERTKGRKADWVVA
jgi:hypothetical protein